MNPRAARHSQKAQQYSLLAKQRAQQNLQAEIQRRQQAEADFASQLATTRLRILMAQQGDDATELLAALAVVIGTPCQAAAQTQGRTAEVRRLHGALRTIVDMCLTHRYRWQSDCALALEGAAELAGSMKPQLNVETFALAWADSLWLAEAILKHAVSNDMVATA